MRAASIVVLSLLVSPAATIAAATYDLEYRVAFKPQEKVANVTVTLQGKRLPSRVTFDIDPARHKNFSDAPGVATEKSSVVWRPKGKKAVLSYDFVVDHKRGNGGYDSLMRPEWAIFRGDRLVPPVRVSAPKGLESKATLRFALPEQWSIATPYGDPVNGVIAFDQPNRKFDRPTGWMLAGQLGRRIEHIDGVITTVAAPAGGEARRQDTLAFLNWNLPRLLEVFPNFPKRLLIVMAGDPMWRGGLSGPSSMFIHADRPLVSENRTSTLLHELVHIAMRIRGGPQSDWIVEGFAEYYSLEVLHRSGGISERRYNEAIAWLEKWAAGARSVAVDRSSGPVTARGVLILIAADREIRQLTKGKRSLDDVAAALAEEGGEVTLDDLKREAKKIAGRSLDSLERVR